MNRVIEKLREVSDELHEMEIDHGVDFTDEEEQCWVELTLLIENNGEVA